MPTTESLARLARLDWLTDGPLSAVIAQYVEALQAQRYARSTAGAYLRCLAHFSYWMREEGLAVESVDGSLVEHFVRQPSSRKVICTDLRSYLVERSSPRAVTLRGARPPISLFAARRV